MSLKDQHRKDVILKIHWGNSSESEYGRLNPKIQGCGPWGSSRPCTERWAEPLLERFVVSCSVMKQELKRKGQRCGSTCKGFILQTNINKKPGNTRTMEHQTVGICTHYSKHWHTMRHRKSMLTIHTWEQSRLINKKTRKNFKHGTRDRE